jgi:V8-like Glu-specific endopeptidase
MSIVDEFPFPFQKPMAQELMRVMAGFYRTEREAVLFTQPFGIDPLTITPGLNSINLWHELLDQLAIQGTVRPAVQATRDQFAKNPRAPFLDDLLANRPAPMSAEPVSDHGPGFDDSVSKPEALLFFDDLTMQVGKVPNLIETLTRMFEIAPAVCLIQSDNIFGTFFGTGFRISNKLILSNHHVLFPKDQAATKVQTDFGFDVDRKGSRLAVASLFGKVSTIKGEQADDWAVIEVPQMDPKWPILPLENAPVPQVGDLAYILQHPGGQLKRLGFVRNMISDIDDGRVRYLTDTEPGSSGAPVLDSVGRLIALHHRGGQPVEIAGKPPVAKNQGIRISRVLARLKANGLVE